MSFFTKFSSQLFQKVCYPLPSTTQVETHYMQTVDKQLENGDRILVKFGRAKTPVYILFHDIPQSTKLLVDLSKLSPPDRQVVLPDIAEFMWDKYLNWRETVEETATKFSWGHIFLLAHTTKVLLDEHAHHKSLNALITKGESVNYQMEAMFNMSEWNLVHLTVKAGEARDDATRETVSRLFKGCPMLLVEMGVSTQELHDVGLDYDAYAIDHLRLPIVGPRALRTMDENMVDVDGFADSSAHEQVTDTRKELPEVFETEDAESQGEASDDEWDIVSVTGLDSYDSDSDQEDLLDNHTAEAYEEQTVTNAPIQPSEDLANQLAGLAVQEEGVATGDTADNVASQMGNHISDAGVTALQQNEMPVDQQVDGSVVDSSVDILVPQKIVFSHDLSTSTALTTEDEMNATIAKTPREKSSKRGSNVENKFPVPLDTETMAALTDFVNDSTDVANSVISDQDSTATTEVDRESGVTPEGELPHLPSESESPDDLPQTACEARFDASHPEYVAGFVPIHDLPRTVPGTPAMIEADADSSSKHESAAPSPKRRGQKRNISEVNNSAGFMLASDLPRTAPDSRAQVEVEADTDSDSECEPAAPRPKPRGQKRNARELEDAWEVFGTKHARNYESDEWDTNIRPHADRQVKEPSIIDLKKWSENPAVDAQPRPNLFEKCMVWSSEKGVFVDLDDQEVGHNG
jgi:hypothetical protein